MSDIEPFLRWAGGKRALAAHVAREYPDKIDLYVEPFVGGGAVFCHLLATDRFSDGAYVVLNDANSEIANLWRYVLFQPEKLIEECERLRALASKNRDDEKAYYWLRAKDMLDGGLARAARTFLLNRTCFNGVYRVNSDGKYNVPYGKLKRPAFPYARLRAIAAAADALALRTIVYTGDFADAVESATELPPDMGCYYFDPPYVPLNDTSFDTYAYPRFMPGDQQRLTETAMHLYRGNNIVVGSNSWCDETLELYSDPRFVTRKVHMRRNVNRKGGERNPVAELLYTVTGEGVSYMPAKTLDAFMAAYSAEMERVANFRGFLLWKHTRTDHYYASDLRDKTAVRTQVGAETYEELKERLRQKLLFEWEVKYKKPGRVHATAECGKYLVWFDRKSLAWIVRDSAGKNLQVCKTGLGEDEIDDYADHIGEALAHASGLAKDRWARNHDAHVFDDAGTPLLDDAGKEGFAVLASDEDGDPVFYGLFDGHAEKESAWLVIDAVTWETVERTSSQKKAENTAEKRMEAGTYGVDIVEHG